MPGGSVAQPPNKSDRRQRDGDDGRRTRFGPRAGSRAASHIDAMSVAFELRGACRAIRQSLHVVPEFLARKGTSRAAGSPRRREIMQPAIRASRSLDDQLVDDLPHAAQRTGNLHGPLTKQVRIDAAGKRDDRIARFDVDLQRLETRLGDERGLHFGGQRGVVDDIRRGRRGILGRRGDLIGGAIDLPARCFGRDASAGRNLQQSG